MLKLPGKCLHSFNCSKRGRFWTLFIGVCVCVCVSVCVCVCLFFRKKFVYKFNSNFG